MSPEEFEKLPIIALKDTGNSDSTGYTELQQFFLPYIGYYHELLWLCFFGTLAYLIIKFIIRPLLKRGKNT